MKEVMFESARITPLGDRAIVVRFANELGLLANERARLLAAKVERKLGPLVEEQSSNLVSCVFHYNPNKVAYETLRQEIALLISSLNDSTDQQAAKTHKVEIVYDLSDEGGLAEVCASIGCTPEAFIKYHTKKALTALALGFSPGFLYLGLHEAPYIVPRRATVQEGVPAGAVMFAAGQTAISSRPIRTGWHVIGHTSLRNFNAENADPVVVKPGDKARFMVVDKL